jgi:hypothetical protein
MSKASVFCLSTSRRQAQDIVSQLKVAGFFSNEISVLFPYHGTLLEFPVDKVLQAPKRGYSGELLATLGWLAGTGTVKIPGVPLLIGSGPILNAFGSNADGKAAKTIFQGLKGLGIPESKAKHYDLKIRSGDILIATHTENSTEVAVAREIFAYSKATAISLGAPKSESHDNPIADAANYQFA